MDRHELPCSHLTESHDGGEVVVMIIIAGTAMMLSKTEIIDHLPLGHQQQQVYVYFCSISSKVHFDSNATIGSCQLFSVFSITIWWCLAPGT